MDSGHPPQPSRRSVLCWLSSALTLSGFPASGRAQTPSLEGKKPPAAAEAAASSLEIKDRLQSGIALLDRLYWCPDLDIWLDKSGDQLRAFYEGSRNPPWWSCANAVELLIDFMDATGSHSHDAALAALHAAHHENADHMPAVIAALKKRGQWSEKDEARQQAKPRVRRSTRAGYTEFCNEYLDDSGWWGLAWLKMHRRTGAPSYLATARAIHQHMASHQLPEPDGGGGVIWNLEQQPPVTNAISNLLFLNLSARLYLTTREQAYLDAALRTEAWVRKAKLYDGTGIVDGPGHKDDHWTYNQGTWAGGLAGLFLATGNPAWLDECATFLNGLLDRGGVLTADGVIREKLSTKGWDTALFKGVLANYLGRVLRLLEKRKAHSGLATRLRGALAASAASMIKNSTGPDGQFAMQWEAGAKDQEYNFNTHLAGLMLLNTQLPPAAVK